MNGLKRVKDIKKRISAKEDIDGVLRGEVRATRAPIKMHGRDFGKPEHRLWAGQWMHEHTVAEFVEHWGVPKQTAYRWRHEYRRSRGLVR